MGTRSLTRVIPIDGDKLLGEKRKMTEDIFMKLPRMKVNRFQYKLYNNKLRKFERRELTYVEDKNKVQESIC